MAKRYFVDARYTHSVLVNCKNVTNKPLINVSTFTIYTAMQSHDS